ncbi:MAG: competence/damage-inducible protein A [Peptococcaceae bacterium]|nr:competence/damage-inducible protein A [Peptococcaceae bacterium]
MKAELISTGTELLLGQTLNTNAYYLSQKLTTLGINVYYHTTVGDNPERLETALEQALQRSDLVITTGGLGPTLDDLTKDTVCKVMGLERELHEESLIWVQGFFAKLGRDMPENNLRQAYFPQGSRIIPNRLGTAPGAIVEKGEKIVIILPGPPFEMQPMFEETVESFLQEKVQVTPETTLHKVYRVFGMAESAVEEALGEVLTTPEGVSIALLAKQAEIHVRVAAHAQTALAAEQLLAGLTPKIESKLGDAIFGIDAEDMASSVGKLLRATKLSLVTAESCTGGLIGGAVTAVAGSSDYYHGGYVTYTNGLKKRLLGVERATLTKWGAVSAETAREMASGARLRTGADIAVAVTGIAGPDGGSPEKPVGLVFVGLATPDDVLAYRYNFFGDRQAIRALTVNGALNRVRLYLLDKAREAN